MHSQLLDITNMTTFSKIYLIKQSITINFKNHYKNRYWYFISPLRCSRAVNLSVITSISGKLKETHVHMNTFSFQDIFTTSRAQVTFFI